MTVQKRKGEIFSILSKGQFICSNSTNLTTRKLYQYIEEHFEEVSDYFLEINFILERGDEYFYFSKTERKADLERKLEAAFKWIDIIDFFNTYENSFGAGFRFIPADILVRLTIDATLKNKLTKLAKYTKEQNFNASIEKLIEMLCKEGFAELENEISSSYKILNSFSYLQELLSNIHIPDEVQNEIPE